MNMTVAPLDALKAENENLREQVAYLRGQLTPVDTTIPLEWKLSPSEKTLFLCLLGREMATNGTLMTALYIGRAKEEPYNGIIRVFIEKMRRKLRPFGVEISTSWGEGYSLSPEVRARFVKQKKEGRPVRPSTIWRAKAEETA